MAGMSHNLGGWSNPRLLKNLVQQWDNDSFAQLVHPHWLDYEQASDTFHILSGSLILVVGIAAIFGNSLVIHIFLATKSLKSKSNALVINLAICDLTMASILTPMYAASSFKFRWLFGYNVPREPLLESLQAPSSISSGNKRREQQVQSAKIILLVICGWALAWTPYTISSLLGVSGAHSYYTPLVCHLPAIFAKTSAAYNPISMAMDVQHYPPVPPADLFSPFSSIRLQEFTLPPSSVPAGQRRPRLLSFSPSSPCPQKFRWPIDNDLYTWSADFSSPAPQYLPARPSQHCEPPTSQCAGSTRTDQSADRSLQAQIGHHGPCCAQWSWQL
ncbi:hypothetical protein RvY_06206 [Ramazzottius varieornatus]|uniref:G-protein coupled receptors family 1 profile domain-containing protein n=1 Tax=Ramazzottius varieornatus TaxID=947166 RepID=A0A1D1UYA3_RAMVA|nr:hypothetical protein RvY_06206 [Ramazzottius varieornatus]